MDADVPTGSHFTILFKPMKDTVKNWNIDLANLLQSYMDELNSIEVHIPTASQAASSQFQKNAAINFTEAAFLIQVKLHCLKIFMDQSVC